MAMPTIQKILSVLYKMEVQILLTLVHMLNGCHIKLIKLKGIKLMNDIGWAVKQLWNKDKVCRSGWNGKNMYLELQIPDANSKMSLPYVYMKTADNNLVPWLCSQTDLLATDWMITNG